MTTRHHWTLNSTKITTKNRESSGRHVRISLLLAQFLSACVEIFVFDKIAGEWLINLIQRQAICYNDKRVRLQKEGGAFGLVGDIILSSFFVFVRSFVLYVVISLIIPVFLSFVLVFFLNYVCRSSFRSFFPSLLFLSSFMLCCRYFFLSLFRYFCLSICLDLVLALCIFIFLFFNKSILFVLLLFLYFVLPCFQSVFLPSVCNYLFLSVCLSFFI